MRFLGVLAALALGAHNANAAVSEELTRELLYNGIPQIGKWMAINKGLISADKVDTGLQVASFAAGGNEGSTGHDIVDASNRAPVSPAVVDWGTTLQEGTLTDNPPSKNKNKAYCWSSPRSHFDCSQYDNKFCQRYWIIGEQYYKPGGPIFVNDGGEGAADGLGLWIVLEHRYYGWSVPVPDFSTDNLRFLNNEEAVQDYAQFIRNWVPPAGVLDHITDKSIFHPDKTPWILYGGSYPGGRAAHMRVLHSDIVWGAISSSGVTVAKESFPEYHDAFIKYGPQDCVTAWELMIKEVDDILDNYHHAAHDLKALFGLEALTDEDFASVLTYPLSQWQGQYWTRENAHTNTLLDGLCPALVSGNVSATIANGSVYVNQETVAWAKWWKAHDACAGQYVEACYSTQDDKAVQGTSLDQTWRLWTWQTCNQWGYLMHAPAPGKRSVVSKRRTLEYNHKICRQAYPAGQFYQVPAHADVDAVNKIGGYDIAADRLAIINGEYDPWRYVTPASPIARKRESTDTRPFYTIPKAVHVYDLWESPTEPQRIKDVHAYMKSFMRVWMQQWKDHKAKRDLRRSRRL